MLLNLNNVFTHIQKQVSPNSLINSCGGGGCPVYLTNIPNNRIVIDVEEEFRFRGARSSRCDQLLFYENQGILFAVPIELKSGKGSAAQIRRQLQGGLKFAATLVQGLNKIVYVPIVFTKRGINPTSPKHQKRALKTKLGSKPLTILKGQCGGKENLARVLCQAGYL